MVRTDVPAWLSDFSAQTAGDFLRLCHTCVGKGDAELLAAITTQQVIDAQAGLQGAHQGPDHFIPDGMAVAVVEVLEVIDIGHDAAQTLALLSCAHEQVVQQAEEGSTVQAAGQRIATGQFAAVPGSAGGSSGVRPPVRPGFRAVHR